MTDAVNLDWIVPTQAFKARSEVTRCLVLNSVGLNGQVFLNLLFAEPMVCTPDSRGFRHFRGSRDFR